MKDAHAKGKFNLCEDSWIGCLCDVSHRILLGLVGAEGCVMWHHGLCHFDRSSVLTWPGRLVSIEGSGHTYFEHSDAVTRPSLLPLTSLEGVQACTFVWRPYAWQVRSLPKGAARIAILPFVDDGPMGVLELAARSAFWAMDRATVVALASTRKIPTRDDASLAELLFSVMKDILAVSDEAVIALLRKRLAVNELPNTLADIFLDIEDAHELLDRSDAADLLSEQAAMQQRAQDDIVFKRLFREKQEALYKGAVDGARRQEGQGARQGRRALRRSEHDPAGGSAHVCARGRQRVARGRQIRMVWSLPAASEDCGVVVDVRGAGSLASGVAEALGPVLGSARRGPLSVPVRRIVGRCCRCRAPRCCRRAFVRPCLNLWPERAAVALGHRA